MTGGCPGPVLSFSDRLSNPEKINAFALFDSIEFVMVTRDNSGVMDSGG
jgi:hypothetical protein